MIHANVQDASGQPLDPCSPDKARRLLTNGTAVLVSEEPLTIRLTYPVERKVPQETPRQVAVGRMLLHLCCGPCATYTVTHLREVGWQVTGHWYNPNIHPFAEHTLRRDSLARFAESVKLPMLWEPGYDMPAFFRAVAGQERFRERCVQCYRIRLERTAAVARAGRYDAISTSLLISPYQDQAAIRRIGEEVAAAYDVTFYFENLRRGFGEHYRMARELGLYMQSYCGCLYSEWEARDRQASTNARRPDDPLSAHMSGGASG